MPWGNPLFLSNWQEYSLQPDYFIGSLKVRNSISATLVTFTTGFSVFLCCLFILNKLSVFDKFYIYRKFSEYSLIVQRVPVCPSPRFLAFPIVEILCYHGTFVKTKKPVLAHYCQLNSRLCLDFTSFSMSLFCSRIQCRITTLHLVLVSCDVLICDNF